MKHIQKKRRLFQSIITTSLLSISAAALLAGAAITYFTYYFLIQEKGKSRVEVLQQISDSNIVNRTSMVNVMNMVYEEYYGLLMEPGGSAAVEVRMRETASLLRRIGMDYTVDILMNDKRVFSTGSDEKNIRSLTTTYWYIKHYSGETDTSWNLRFLDKDDISSFGLSYGRTIYSPEGDPLGVIIVTTAQEALFRTFQQLVSDGVTVYILDRNGIIISHSNPQRVGNWMANMEAFEQDHGRNSSHLVRKRGGNVMFSNYHDPGSGWTFVEEQSVDSLLKDGLMMLQQCVLVVLLGGLLTGWAAFVRVRCVTDVFADFSERIRGMPADRLTLLPVLDNYEETYVLSTTFNGMITRIQGLIRDIQLREQEKQRTEYDFLHAQIDPHFLNNTLLAVKSLLAMGEMERAGRMMNELVDLLHIPSTPEIQFVTLEEELHLVRNYISIMNCRTEKGVHFLCKVPSELMRCEVPRMILQPIIGNSFFHGFAERDEGCEIRLQAGLRGSALYIEVTDNGEGIDEKRLSELRSWSYTSGNSHHGIGLKNIRRRLEIIYGGRSGVAVSSKPGESTTVTVTMDRYRETRRTAEGGGYEDIGR